MTMKEKLVAQGFKTYENEDIQVFWKPRIYQHVGECARDKDIKILPVCSYAKKLMTGKDEFKDVM